VTHGIARVAAGVGARLTKNTPAAAFGELFFALLFHRRAESVRRRQRAGR
jgi:hypothetical protein